MSQNASETCPCGSGAPYARCCGPLHAGAPAADAAALMRSRYCAYVRGLARYLLDTWHVSTRPATLDLEAVPPTRWLALKVLRHTPAGADAATVEFIARARVGGRGLRMHERSRFVREGGRWYYLDGDHPETAGDRPEAEHR